jgi:hypothetical protein
MIGKIKNTLNYLNKPKSNFWLFFFLFLSFSAFAQFTPGGTKLRLGYQTTADGLVWRGSLSDTASIQPTNTNSSWVILDTINLKFYSFDLSSNVWNQLPSGVTIDTTSLSNRINKKLDTLYVNYQTSVDLLKNKDTINITTLDAGAGINIVNNVISLDTTLLDSVVRVQNVYVKNGTGTVLNKGEAVYVTGANGTNIIVGRASNVAESTSSKTLGLTMTSIGVNGFGYVIKEGLLAGLNTKSANAGDPIWLSNTPGGLIFGLTNKPYAPNHLVYLGVVTRSQQNNGEVYVTVQNGFEIKELHDVQIINPLNKSSLYYNLSESLWRDTTAALLVSDTATMLNPYFKKADTTSLSDRINLKLDIADSTITLIGNVTGTGSAGSTINTTIGNGVVTNNMLAGGISDTKLDTIITSGKVANSATTATTAYPYIPSQHANTIVLRNSNGDFGARNISATNFYGLASTATIANSIQSINTTGIIKLTTLSDAVSPIITVPDVNATMATTNSNQTFSGTQTFNGSTSFNGNVFGLTSSIVGLGNVDNTSDANKPISTATQTALNLKQNILTNPITGTGFSSFLPRFSGSTTLDTTRIFYSNGRLGLNMDATEASTHLTSRFVIRDFGHNFKFDGSAAGSGYSTTFSNDDSGLKIGHNSNIRDIRFTLNGTSGLTIANTQNSPARAVGIGTDAPIYNLDVAGTFRATGNSLIGGTLGVTGAITKNGNNVLTNADTTSMLNPYFRDADTTLLNLTSRFALKANLNSPTFTGTVGGISKSMVGLGNVDNTSDANKPISTATQTALNLKLNISDTTAMLTNYLRTGVAASTYQTKLSGSGFVKASGTTISYDNSSYLPLTGGTLSSDLNVLGNISVGSLSQYTGQSTRYLKATNISPYIDLFIGSLGTIGTWRGRIHFQTSNNTETPTTAMMINEFGNINMNGTLGVTGAITLSTTSATPTTLLGKDGSNVVGTVTTVAQTGLMTTGVTTFTTSGSVATFDVTHNLGIEPTSVIVTPNAINGSTKIFYEIIAKTSTTFRVQAFNVADGSIATNKTVSVYWMAIK